MLNNIVDIDRLPFISEVYQCKYSKSNKVSIINLLLLLSLLLLLHV